MVKQIVIFSLSILCVLFTNAQLNDDYHKSAPQERVYGFRASYGNTIVHTPAVEVIRGARPYGFGFEYSKQSRDSATYRLCGAYPRKGIQFQYYHYNSIYLGNAAMASYFIQPVYRINNRLSFFYKASFGFTYADNPFREDNKIDTLNQCYSLHVNPYLQLAAGWGFRLNKHLSLEWSSTFDHISNGNVNRPNRGLNWVTNSVSLLYKPFGTELPKYTRVKNKYWKGRPLTYTAGVLYVARQDYAGFTMGYQRTFAAGGFLEASKQIGRIHGFVVGLQSYYNNLKVDPQDSAAAYIKNKHSSVLAGLYVGHEFLMGRVIISQVIGRYVTVHPGMYNNYFHQHSLRVLLDKHWMAGFCFRAHEDEADYIGLNMMYRFSNFSFKRKT